MDLNLKNKINFPVKLVEHELLERGYKGNPGVSVVRDDTKEIITNASSKYQLVKHMDVLDSVESAFNLNQINYKLTDIRMLGKKKTTMRAFYKTDREYKVGNDPFFYQVIVNNSYDTLTRFFLQAGLFRVVCSNGMIIAGSEVEQQELVHINQNIQIQNVFLKLDQNIKKVMPDVINKIESLYTMSMTIAQAFNDEKLKNAFPTGKLYEQFQESGVIFDNFQKLGNNRYALLNAITEFATHHVDNDGYCLTLQEKALKICLN